MIDARIQHRADVIKALAHPSRLAMVEVLERGERCVCDLRDVVGADISTVSKHLALMKQAGIVIDRREGQKIFYRLRCPCIIRFLDCVDAVLAENGK